MLLLEKFCVSFMVPALFSYTPPRPFHLQSVSLFIFDNRHILANYQNQTE